MTWSLNDYIITLRSELRSWRKVYWRLWGDCHFLLCKQCDTYFPINQANWCSYHPEDPQFFINEQQRATPFPLGRYPCCSQRAFRYEALTNREGCSFRVSELFNDSCSLSILITLFYQLQEHLPFITSQSDVNILNIYTAYKDVIALPAPRLYFAEKVTRLVARDQSVPIDKLACKESMWWDGIEILPAKPKLGLLGARFITKL